MRNFVGGSIADLISGSKEDITTLLRQEVELAKKEISEKASTCARNSARVAAGGFVAYAGLILFLAGIGLVIGFAFEKAGLGTTLAVFIGLSIAGLLVSAAGGLMVSQGIKGISSTSLVPEKTIDTIKHIGDANNLPISKPVRANERSSEEIYESAIKTAERVHEDKEELAFQLSPQQLKKRVIRNIKNHPLAWSAASLGGAAVVAGGVVFGRKFLVRGARAVGIRAVKMFAHWV